MLSLGDPHFAALSPVDMRAGFNRLYAHVQTTLQQID